MRTFAFATIVASIVFATGVLVTGRVQAAPFGAAIEDLDTVETAQFVFQGRSYCWYVNGWNGPGWYWCGYAWQVGVGWGGAAGWNGWSAGSYSWRARYDWRDSHGNWHHGGKH